MKHKQVQQHKFYKSTKDSVERIKKACPRCGDSFLAQHKDRLTCGKCKFTEFLNKN